MEDEAAERAAVIARLERSVRGQLRAQLFVVPLGVLTIVNLLTGLPAGESRVDQGLLVVVGGYEASLLSDARLIRTLRNDAPLSVVNRRLLRNLVLTIGVSTAFLAFIGWLVGGWVAAIVLGACGAVWWAASLRWIRQRAKRRVA